RPRAPARAAAAGPSLRTLAWLSGFASFAAQVLLTQAFARVLNQSTFPFGAVGLVTLLPLALGALLVAALERSERVAREQLLGGALVVAALGFAAFPAVFVSATAGLASLGSARPWPAYGIAAFRLPRPPPRRA